MRGTNKNYYYYYYYYYYYEYKTLETIGTQGVKVLLEKTRKAPLMKTMEYSYLND